MDNCFVHKFNVDLEQYLSQGIIIIITDNYGEMATAFFLRILKKEEYFH